MNGMFDDAKGFSYSYLSRLSYDEPWAEYIINEDFGYKERDFYDFLSNKSRNELEQIMQLIGFDI